MGPLLPSKVAEIQPFVVGVSATVSLSALSIYVLMTLAHPDPLGTTILWLIAFWEALQALRLDFILAKTLPLAESSFPQQTETANRTVTLIPVNTEDQTDISTSGVAYILGVSLVLMCLAKITRKTKPENRYKTY